MTTEYQITDDDYDTCKDPTSHSQPCWCAEHDEDDPQFWVMEHNTTTERDMLHSIADDDLIPLVDEASGGIIAYVLRGNEESILAHLNGR